MELQWPILSSLPDHGPIGLPISKQRWRRNQVACDACHSRRVRCDMVSPAPCSRCQARDVNCAITRTRRKRGRIAKSKLAKASGGHDTSEFFNTPAGCAEEMKIEEKCSTISPPSSSPINLLTPDSVTQQPSPVFNEIDALLALEMGDGCQGTTDAQLLEGLGMGIPDDWVSTRDFPVLSPDDEAALSPLPDIWTVDGIAPREAGLMPPQPPSPPKRDKAASESTARPPLKYQVLKTMMPFLETHLSPRLVNDLLELYFTGQNVHCQILHRPSFLSQECCSAKPALLASILWLAASNDGVFSSLSEQRRVCQFLSDLTKTLLQPSGSDHVSSPGCSMKFGTLTADEALSPTTNDILESLKGDGGLPKPAGNLDDLITYIHIAYILSAVQDTAALAWWEACFASAKQLNLNQEIPDMTIADLSNQTEYPCRDFPTRSILTEVYREERRRTWWLLYTMDRHLALCHNRSVSLLDKECHGLLFPLDEASWLNETNNSSHDSQSERKSERRCFPDFRCHDSSLFGLLLPVMTIMGDIIQLNYGRQHDKEVTVAQVLRHIEIYHASLMDFTPSTTSLDFNLEASEPFVNPQADKNEAWHRETVDAYSSYLAHALKLLLLLGKCDWPSLIESNDFGTSSVFADTVSHTIEADFWLKQILRFDPDTRFMPSFFGIQLVLAGFPVLLVVDRFQKESGTDILNAGETIIRATESCLVSRSTEYGKMFRQVMRSALSQAWGRPLSGSEIRRRRQAIVHLYQWIRKENA